MKFFNPFKSIDCLQDCPGTELTGTYPDVIIRSIAPVAQRIELGIPNPSAAGSIPARCG